MGIYTEYSYVKTTLFFFNNDIAKTVMNVSKVVLDSDKLASHESACIQGIVDEYNSGAPIFAWTNVIVEDSSLDKKYTAIEEIWCVKTSDLSDFLKEVDVWRDANEAKHFSAYWYRQLLYTHIEMYQLSELLTNGFFIELMKVGKE